MEHNLLGTVNLLELLPPPPAAFVLLSTSRVYSIEPLAGLPMRVVDRAFEPDTSRPRAGRGLPGRRRRELLDRAPRVALRPTKVASEQLALEYGADLRLPRLGRPLRRARGRRPVRPARPGHLRVLGQQLAAPPSAALHRLRRPGAPGARLPAPGRPRPRSIEAQLTPRRGRAAARGERLRRTRRRPSRCRQMSDWCRDRLFDHPVASDTRPRPFDLPWMVLDAARASEVWGWAPTPRHPRHPRRDPAPRRGEPPLAGAFRDGLTAMSEDDPGPDPSLPRSRSSRSSSRRATRRAASPRPCEHLHLELQLHGVPHEIVVVDDGSSDRTWAHPPGAAEHGSRSWRRRRTPGPHGFGRAVIHGLDATSRATPSSS